jgi:hypothetical protein
MKILRGQESDGMAEATVDRDTVKPNKGSERDIGGTWRRAAGPKTGTVPDVLSN